MLQFNGIEKRFPDGTLALQDVGFDVPRGQFCVILGPSGSGKSTLLRMVNGMHWPTGGRIAFDGTEITRKSIVGVQRRVGMVHQQFNLVPRATVLDNVIAGALPAVSTLRVLFRVWPAHLQTRACRLLERVGLLEEQLYRRATQLSGGQQQRVAIARAFMLEPDVVLADEPVASLDPAISRSILALLADASKETETTVLCSLHQVDLAKAFADRIVALRAGKLAFDGPPSGLTDDILAGVYGDSAGVAARSEPGEPS